MLIQNKRTKIQYPVDVQTWNRMKDIDGTNLQKLYTVLDTSELKIKEWKIDIKHIVQQTEEVDIGPVKKPIEEAIEFDEFNSEDYTIGEIESFLVDKEIDDYIDKLVNDSRKGINKLIYG